MSIIAHFSCGSNPFSCVVSAPTDVFNIVGSNTSLVRIIKIGISSTQTTNGVNNWSIVKRSSNNSGGVIANPSIVQFDSLSIAPSAVTTNYIEPPTLGTLVATIKSFSLNSPSVSTPSISSQFYEFNFEESGRLPLILRNANESISLNFLGGSLPLGLSVNCFVRWVEEL